MPTDRQRQRRNAWAVAALRVVEGSDARPPDPLPLPRVFPSEEEEMKSRRPVLPQAVAGLLRVQAPSERCVVRRSRKQGYLGEAPSSKSCSNLPAFHTVGA